VLIYIAEDHQIVAKGMEQLLQSIEVGYDISILKNGQELLEAIQTKEPDIVLLDIEMPVLNGIDTLKLLRKKNTSTRVLMLTMMEELAIVDTCFQLGANGFIHKDCSLDELKLAIETVQNGQKFVSQQMRELMLRVPANQAKRDTFSVQLTNREKEILRLICEGYTSKEIGDQLFISHRTVETHKDNMMRKLDVNSTAKLISIALKMKLI
jgi:DNA-binding NarL/FixJ family response regulator